MLARIIGLQQDCVREKLARHAPSNVLNGHSAHLTAEADAAEPTQDMSAFDRFGAVYEGQFNRAELYDRKVLR